jgi:hypothetical protein
MALTQPVAKVGELWTTELEISGHVNSSYLCGQSLTADVCRVRQIGKMEVCRCEKLQSANMNA